MHAGFHIPLTGLQPCVIHKTDLYNIRALFVCYLHHMITTCTQNKLFYGEHEVRVLKVLTYYVTNCFSNGTQRLLSSHVSFQFIVLQ